MKEEPTEYRRYELIHEMERLYMERPYSDQELATKLGADRSTIFRIRRVLTELLGLPIDPAAGARGKYQMDKSHRIHLMPVSPQEATMLYLAARRLQQQTKTAQQDVGTALSKLSHALHKPLAQELQKAAQDLLTQEADNQRTKVLATLIDCWLNERLVRIKHRKLHGQARTYEVSPYLLEPAVWGDGTYLIGYSEYHNGLATFKVERIETAVTSMGAYRPRQGGVDIQELLQQAWGVWHSDGEPVQVVLRFSAQVEPRVMESVWHPSQEVVRLAGGGCEWRVQVADWREMVPWVRGWGSDCEVVEPVELKASIMREVRKMMKTYGLAQEITSETTSPVEKEQPQGEVPLTLIGTTFTVTNEAPEFANDVPPEMMEMFQAYMDDDDE